MNKKEKITQTTLQLIVDQGIQATPMSQISRVSGVAMGTIYHHFSSKKEIINFIYLELKKDFGEAILKDVVQNNEYKEQFFQIWKNIFEFYRGNELKFKFSQYVGNLPIIDDATKEEGLTFYAPAIAFLEKGVQLKWLKQVDINLLVETVHGSVVALALLAHSKKLIITKAILKQAITMSWDGVSIKKNNK